MTKGNTMGRNGNKKRKNGSRTKGNNIDGYYASRAKRVAEAKARRKVKFSNAQRINVDYIETEIDK